PDRGPRAYDGFAPEHARVRINGDIIFHGRMPLTALANPTLFIALKTARTQRYPMKQLHMDADLARLADNNPRPVINKKMRTDFCSRMNVDPSPRMCPFRHQTRDEWHIFLI